MRLPDSFFLRDHGHVSKTAAQSLRRAVAKLDDHDTRQYLLEAINHIELNGQGK